MYTRYDAARTGDYSLSSLEMGVALNAIPPQRRSDAWLLLLAAPIGTAALREVLRHGKPGDLAPNYWTLLGPAITSALSGAFLFATRYSATQGRSRRSY
jgi:hypothetical protein